MAKREKKEILTEVITLQDAETIYAEYAKAEAEKDKIGADIAKKIVALRDNATPRMNELNEIQTKAFARLQHFAQTNPALFDKAKSLKMIHGTLGFRTSPPSLATLTGYTWKSVATLLKEFMPSYVREAVEVNKELILDKRSEIDAKDLEKCGIAIRQAETFFVEPKKDNIKTD